MTNISTQRTLIITGGSRGIGKATVEHFLKNNWRVINLSRTPSDIVGVKDMAVDLQQLAKSEEKLKKLFAQELGEKTIINLVHNAGAFIHDTVDAQAAQAMRELLEVNLISAIILNQLLIPHMAAGSSIIYVGSTLAEKAVPGCASYVISKHAVAGLMKATCQDLAGQQIHTCCVCPGVTETDMLRERCQDNPQLLQTLSNISAYKRLVQPKEIAQLIWFCATHPVINGTIIHGNLGEVTR